MDFLQQLWTIVNHGGVLMVALFLLAVALYWLAFDTLVKLPKPLSLNTPDSKAPTSFNDVLEYKIVIIEYFKGRKILLQTLTTVAPLFGLLGTVMGMLATFKGKAVSNGDTLDLIAAGISEAMITTETGLIIAIPASLLVILIGVRIEALEAALAQQETKITMQQLAVNTQG